MCKFIALINKKKGEHYIRCWFDDKIQHNSVLTEEIKENGKENLDIEGIGAFNINRKFELINFVDYQNDPVDLVNDIVSKIDNDQSFEYKRNLNKESLDYYVARAIEGFVMHKIEERQVRDNNLDKLQYLYRLAKAARLKLIMENRGSYINKVI